MDTQSQRNGATTQTGAVGLLDLLLARHLTVPAGSPLVADGAIRRLERRVDGALGRLLGPHRRMRQFGAVELDTGGLYLSAYRETLPDGAVAQVGAYYGPAAPQRADHGLRPETVYWTLQISGEQGADGPSPGYAWYDTASEAADALHLSAGRHGIREAGRR